MPSLTSVELVFVQINRSLHMLLHFYLLHVQTRCLHHEREKTSAFVFKLGSFWSCQLCLERRKILKSLNLAIVVLTFKEDHVNLENYRPINLLSHIYTHLPKYQQINLLIGRI